jgi:hypothetical protein
MYYNSPYRKVNYYSKNIYPEPLNREELPSTEKIMVRAYLTDISLPSCDGGITIAKFNERFKEIEEYAKDENATNLTIREHEYSEGGGYGYESSTYYSVVVMCERLETDEELASRMEHNKEEEEAQKEREKDDRRKLAELKERFEKDA